MIWGLIVKYPRLFGYGVLVVAVIASAWVVNGWKEDAAAFEKLKDQVAAYQAKEAAAQKIATALEEELGKSAAVHQKLKERLRNELRKNTVYADCVVPADGVLLYNEALTGGAAR